MSKVSNARSAQSSGTQKRRRYVSKACDPCRQRRAKVHCIYTSSLFQYQCDGGQPSCSPCLGRSLECNYSAASDGRRPASKSYVPLLRGRIDLLESALRSHSIDVDATVGQLAGGRFSSGSSGESQHRPVLTASVRPLRVRYLLTNL